MREGRGGAGIGGRKRDFRETLRRCSTRGATDVSGVGRGERGHKDRESGGSWADSCHSQHQFVLAEETRDRLSIVVLETL